MKIDVSRLLHVALPLALLGGAVGGLSPRQGLAGSVTRYTSSAYGYSLLAPAGWVQIPHVHWTPFGPAADLTVMTPDHQAAFGVIVVPTGPVHYSDDDLQNVALRLLYQENGVLPSAPITKRRVVYHHLAFQVVSALAGSGNPAVALTSISVAVTQSHRRLYALPGLVYRLIASLPAGGSITATPTPTPENGYGIAPLGRPGGQALAHGAVALPTAAAAPGQDAPQTRLVNLPQTRLDTPPVPLPTDHLRGNPCPSGSDGGLVIGDKNCARDAELNAIQMMLQSFTLAAHLKDDPRTAATIGPDGFALATSSSDGFRVAVPAQWRSVNDPQVVAAAAPEDQNALVTIDVQDLDSATLSLPDLQSAANNAISGATTFAPQNVTYTTRQADGILYLTAYSAMATIPSAYSKYNMGQICVTVASYHRRLYILRGLGIRVGGSSGYAPSSTYPYFTPFTTLARLGQTMLDHNNQETELAVMAARSLYVDPNVP